MEKINKFAYPMDVQPQCIRSSYPDDKSIFVGVEEDVVGRLCVEEYDNGTRVVSGDFLGLDGIETKEVPNPKTYRYCSDVRLILHQKDIAKRFGVDFANRLQDRFGKASQFQQQVDGLSDSDILGMVRSRYIQSPSELKSYSELLLSEASKLKADYESAVADAKAKAEAEAAAQSADAGAAPAGASADA